MVRDEGKTIVKGQVIGHGVIELLKRVSKICCINSVTSQSRVKILSLQVIKIRIILVMGK
jgi:hypothetical protein